MGIPFYFYAIINQFDNIVSDNVPNKCRRFFIDFNSIIHNTAYALLANDQDVDTHIFHKIVEYIHSLLGICTPSDLLYIAIDGVAPCAKMHQQRKRRYMSSYRNNLVNDYKKKNGIKVVEWDSNQITPGTDFMNRLNIYLREYFNNNKFDFEVILSGSDEPKEGEHKFIHYIKDNGCVIGDGCDVIYGLDADLIMLSLTCNKPNIYLMREMTNFQTIKSPSGLSETAKQVCFKYLDIDRLRKAISLYLYDSEQIEYMNDYVFMCFLLGNDFLPSFPFLKLRNNALDILCTAYKKTKNDLGGQLIVGGRTYTINFEFLKMLIELIAKHEDEYIIESTKEYNACKYNTNKRPVNHVDKFSLDLDNYPLMNSMTGLINPIDDSKWRMSYYHHLFVDTSLKDIKDICNNFVEGLVWNMNYYFNRDYSNTWYYKYPYPPSIYDLYNNISVMNEKDLEYIKEKVRHNSQDLHVEAQMQLLMVLPPQSLAILPEKLKRVMTDFKLGCTHYYPSKFNIITYMKYHLWECVPMLPEIHIEHLYNTLLKL